MATAVDGRLRASLHTFRQVFRNPNLRRIELGWAGSITGEWSYAVALGVFAYERGGPAAVGIVGLIRFAPSALAAPFTSLFGDRYRRERVMLATDLTRATGVGAAAAAILLGGPPVLVYGLAGLVQVISTAFRPAQAALLPSLAETPEELTAANVVSSSIESIGTFGGPALGGILLAFTSTGVVFIATAGLFLWSAFNVLRIRTEAPTDAGIRAEASVAAEALAGFRAVITERNLRLLIGLYAAQTLVAGALNVLIVVSALRLLHIGRSGVGFLNSAIGVGGLLGGIAALGLVGRKRLASDFRLGLIFWGLPIALIGVWPSEVTALIFLGVVGIGNTFVDVSGLTLLQRAVNDDVLARVFGVLQSLLLGTIAIGAIVAPALVSGLGVRGALILVGMFLPALSILAWRRLSLLDTDVVVPERQLALLRAIPIFAPLAATTLEQLAVKLAPATFAAGETIFRQGDPGDRFYVVDQGEVEIVVDDRQPIPHGPGSYFGEIALLRDVPRTATVRARTNVELYALDRDEFIAAVTGHSPSRRAADAVIGERLAAFRTGVASV
ncbi:MAG: MFS transporter [Gaiellaceae bacterium]